MNMEGEIPPFSYGLILIVRVNECYYLDNIESEG